MSENKTPAKSLNQIRHECAVSAKRSYARRDELERRMLPRGWQAWIAVILLALAAYLGALMWSVNV